MKGEFPHCLIQVYLALLKPASGVFGNHPLDQGEIAFHVGVGEGWIPQLAMPGVLRGIHVQQAFAQ